MDVIGCSLALPDDFRVADILSFHRRDSLAVAEIVDSDELRKGILWNGLPACLSIVFAAGCAQASLAVDGEAGAGDKGALCKLVLRMLGLDQPIEEFESRYRNHPQLGLLIAAHPGFRVPVAASVFEALTWAIICQQISVKAAVAIRRKLIRLVGLRHSSGLYCYPDALHLVDYGIDDLRRIGFSQNKAQCLLTVSKMIVSGELMLDYSADQLPAERIRSQLLNIRGIGPWTVNYALLRGFGWLDGSLHGDIAVRKGLQKLLLTDDPVSEQQAQQWLAQFSPWRSLIAAHIWAFLSISA